MRAVVVDGRLRGQDVTRRVLHAKMARKTLFR
jgi:hypothetical protein